MRSTDSFYRHIGVYGISVNSNKILVIQKKLGPYKGRYDLPGGRLEDAESLEQGIKREFREETGYSIQELSNIGVCDFSVRWTLTDHTIENIHHIALLYAVHVDPDEEAAEIESFEGQDSNGAIWLPIDEISSANASPLLLRAVDWIHSGTIPVEISVFDYAQ